MVELWSPWGKTWGDPVYHALIVCLGGLSDQGSSFIQSLDRDKPLEFDLKINGQEVPFSRFVEWFRESLDAEVHKEARKLLEEKADVLLDDLYSLQEAVKQVMEFKGLELFPKGTREVY